MTSCPVEGTRRLYDCERKWYTGPVLPSCFWDEGLPKRDERRPTPVAALDTPKCGPVAYREHLEVLALRHQLQVL